MSGNLTTDDRINRVFTMFDELCGHQAQRFLTATGVRDSGVTGALTRGRSSGDERSRNEGRHSVEHSRRR